MTAVMMMTMTMTMIMMMMITDLVGFIIIISVDQVCFAQVILLLER